MKRLDKEFILKTLKGNEQYAVRVSSSIDAVNYARHFYSDDMEIYESVFIILLNRNNNTMGWAKIAQGGVYGAMVDKKLICKYAIEALASGVILVHNHPSGNTQPSAQDIDLAQQIRKALGIFDISLLDSIILSENGYYSMNDND